VLIGIFVTFAFLNKTMSNRMESDPEATSQIQQYPIGSYKVFLEQSGNTGSVIAPKFSVYNAVSGEEIKSIDSYVFYKFFGTKIKDDSISVNCANPQAYYPSEPKSTSGNELTIWGNSAINPNNDPSLDTSIDMYLDKDVNNLSFICIPR